MVVRQVGHKEQGPGSREAVALFDLSPACSK